MLLIIKGFLICGMIGIALLMALIVYLAKETPKKLRKEENSLVVILSVSFLVMYMFAMGI